MNDAHNRMTRRSLLKTGAALAGAAPLGALASSERGAAAQGQTGRDAVAQLQSATVSLLADALRRVGGDPRSQTMSSAIRAVSGAGRVVIGPAVTTEWQVARSGGGADAIRRYVFQPVDQAPPGSVWVVASGTDQLLSMFGDVIALACKRNGMAGAVTDSGCRDVAAMEAADFPVFSKGTVLYGPGDVIQPVAANATVVCGGVEVRPGDVVAADNDGILVIPREKLEEVASMTPTLMEEEDAMRRRIESGQPLVKAYSL